MHPSPESKQIVFTQAMWRAALGLFLIQATACPAGSDDTRPPDDQLFFPTDMALSPDESVLFVLNGNSELRWDSGTIDVVDTQRIEELAAQWQENSAPASCHGDPVLPGVPQCDAAAAMREGAGARVGNFATDIAVQELASGDLRLFVAVRGDPSVTWADYPAATGDLECGNSSQVVPLCDNEHRLLALQDNPDLPRLLNEPYGVLVDPLGGYAMVTHLSLSGVTLIDAPMDGRAPVLSDLSVGLFERDPDTNISAALGIAGRIRAIPEPGKSTFDRVYVAARTEDRVRMMSVVRARADALPSLALDEYFFLNGVDNAIAGGDDSRGIAFNQDGSRLHIINRAPTFLHIYDTEDGADGYPRNEYLGAIELCREPANLEVVDVGRGDRAYVSCFSSGQVWVLDTRSQSIEAIIDVGRGPHALALAQSARRRLYVANFLENTISVVDIEPGSPTENQVLIRLASEEPDSGDQ